MRGVPKSSSLLNLITIDNTENATAQVKMWGKNTVQEAGRSAGQGRQRLQQTPTWTRRLLDLLSSFL